jgi:hypothetical protein
LNEKKMPLCSPYVGDSGLEKRIEWQRFTGNKLRAKGVMRAEWAQGLNERDMDPIQAWCERNNCGTRTSFDTFKFRGADEITMFLLRWG